MQATPRFGLNIPRLCRLGSLLPLCAVLVACGDQNEPTASSVTTAQMVPQDKALAGIYSSSCKLCHSNPASGAPLTGDVQAWAPHLAQGMDTLLDHSINGYQGMPPMGMCMQCSEEEFRALIDFMSGQQDH